MQQRQANASHATLAFTLERLGDVCLFSLRQKYKKPKFIQCFVFSLTGDVLTGDSDGNILTWGKSPGDVKTLGKGAQGEALSV